MYEQHFGFKERPFSIAPDPRFLYLSDSHRDALAHLLYGLSDEGGFVLLVGEVGTGKTTLVRSLLAQVPPHIDIAFLLNPRLDAVELLQTVCDELHIGELIAHTSIKLLVDAINSHLLKANAAGRSTVLLIDEAQNLSAEVLEQLRLLTNLETNERKLLRIILIGQPELATKLARPELRQLSQRITARFHLKPLSRRQTKAYVKHRLSIAQGRGQIFSPLALEYLHWRTAGTPRLINVMADRALLGAYAQNNHQVSMRTMLTAGREVIAPKWNRWRPAWVVGAVFVAVLSAAYWAGFLPTPGALQAATQTNHQPAVTPTSSATTTAPTQEAVAADLTEPIPDNAVAVSPGTLVVPPADESPSNLTEGTSSADDTDTDFRPEQHSAELLANLDAGAEVIAPPPDSPSRSVLTALETSATLDWPNDSPKGRSLDLAFAALFDRWQSPYERGEQTACNYALAVGLNCLFGQGNWTVLTELNQPAILELQDRGGEPYFVALLSLDGNEVEVVIGNRHQRVARELVESNWRGKFTVLWQMPPSYRQPTDHTSAAETVLWLRQQLSKIRGVDLGTAPAFDDSLRQTLKEFQRENGLESDGVAGPRTWIAIHQHSGVPVPRLRQ